MRKPARHLQLMERDKLHIWILEDSPSDAMLIELALRGIAADVTSERITDGQAAVQRMDEAVISATYPDLIFMDINLPRMGAIELAGMMQSKAEFSGQKVIVMSSYAAPGVGDKLLSLGVSLVIQKPTDLHSFRQTVQDAVREVMKR